MLIPGHKVITLSSCLVEAELNGGWSAIQEDAWKVVMAGFSPQGMSLGSDVSIC